jgi:hypothetical protein
VYCGVDDLSWHQPDSNYTQDRALVERIERLEILLQDSRNIEQIIAQPKLYQNMLGNQDNLFVLLKGIRL